ncbi:MAG: hypothetical protein ACHQAX_01645 [Gammaproteobacteria bacterium]
MLVLNMSLLNEIKAKLVTMAGSTTESEERVAMAKHILNLMSKHLGKDYEPNTDKNSTFANAFKDALYRFFNIRFAPGYRYDALLYSLAGLVRVEGEFDAMIFKRFDLSYETTIGLMLKAISNNKSNHNGDIELNEIGSDILSCYQLSENNDCIPSLALFIKSKPIDEDLYVRLLNIAALTPEQNNNMDWLVDYRYLHFINNIFNKATEVNGNGNGNAFLTANVFRFLIKNGFDLNGKYNGQTLLHYAAGLAWWEVVDAILDSPTFNQHNAIGRDGLTAAHIMARNSNYNDNHNFEQPFKKLINKMSIEALSSNSNEGRAALFFARYNERATVLLIKKGVDISERHGVAWGINTDSLRNYRFKLNILHVFSIKLWWDAIDAILDRHDFDKRWNACYPIMETALAQLVHAAEDEKQIGVVKKLYARIVEYQKFLFKCEISSTIALLIEKCDIDLSSRDDEQNNILHTAAEKGWWDVIEASLARADYTVYYFSNSEGPTVVSMLKLKVKNKEQLEIYIKMIDKFPRDGFGDKRFYDEALRLAVDLKEHEIAAMLVNAGAPPYAIDHYGKNLRQIANEHNWTDVCEALDKRGFMLQPAYGLQAGSSVFLISNAASSSTSFGVVNQNTNSNQNDSKKSGSIKNGI